MSTNKATAKSQLKTAQSSGENPIQSTATELKDIPLTPVFDHGDENNRSYYPTQREPVSVSDTTDVKTDLINPSYLFEIERDASTHTITNITVKSPDGEMFHSLSLGDSHPSTIYEKVITNRDSTHLHIEWHRFWVHDIEFTPNNRLLATVIHHPDCNSYEKAISRSSDSHFQSVTLPVSRLCEDLIAAKTDAFASPKWHTNPAKWRPDKTSVSTFKQRYYTPESSYEPVESCSELEFEVIEGEGAHDKIDPFLDGQVSPAVEHNLGGTDGKWKAGFGIYHRPEGADSRNLIAAATVDEHPNQIYFEKHNSILISRIACHPARPKNCSTWLIARIRNWAEKEGFDQIGSTAGVNFNQGIVYKAAGFELNKRLTGWVRGDGWTNRKGRSSVHDGNLWYKRKWEYTINDNDPEDTSKEDTPLPENTTLSDFSL